MDFLTCVDQDRINCFPIFVLLTFVRSMKGFEVQLQLTAARGSYFPLSESTLSPMCFSPYQKKPYPNKNERINACEE